MTELGRHFFRYDFVVDGNILVRDGVLALFQLLEELESLEETLNESIRESLGARTGRYMSKKKPIFEDEEDGDDRYYISLLTPKSQ